MAVFTCKTYFDCVNGATDYVARFPTSLDFPALIFCEDKLTMTVETALAEKTGGNFNVEVTSLGRYASTRLKKRNYLSKEGAAMAVKKILTNVAPNLSALKKAAASPTLASETGELIAQLKSAKIRPDELLAATDGLEGKSAAKIRDVANIFAEYERFLAENGLTDSNNALSDVSEAIAADELLPRSAVVFLGFSSITRQSADAITAIARAAKSADFFAVKGDNPDLFTNEFYDFVKKFDPSPKATVSTLTDEGERLLNGLFNPTTFTVKGTRTDKIHLFEADDAAEEAEYVAKRIRREVIENGARYRDIAVGAGDYAAYALTLKRKLSDYGVPYYSDEKTLLSSLPVSKLVNSLFSAIYRRSLDDAKDVIANCLFISDRAASDRIIRSLNASSFTYKSFIDGKFRVGDAFADGKIELLVKYLTRVKRSDTAIAYAAAVRAFLDECGADENAAVTAEKLRGLSSDENAALLESEKDAFLSVVEETERVLGDSVIPLDAYRRVLLSGENAAEMSTVQQRYDCVYLGDLKNCRYKRYSTLFAVGMTSDVPFVKGDSALLLDGDIADLEKLALYVEPKIKAVNDREKEATALALASFKDNLVLTRPALSRSGAPTAKSGITDYLESIFSDDTRPFTVFSTNDLEVGKYAMSPSRRDKADAFDFLAKRPSYFSMLRKCEDYAEGATDDLIDVSSFRAALVRLGDEDGLAACDRLAGKPDGDENFHRNLPAENYFKNKTVTASVLECFYSCPYKCFMRYCVGAGETETGEVKPFDYGNVLHAVAEKFVKNVKDMKSESDCEEFAEKVVDELLSAPEYKRFFVRPDLAYSLSLTKSEAKNLCVKLYREFLASDFTPIGEEVWFSDSSEIKAFPLKTRREGYRLVGKTDRVDRYRDYVRIIDYKTGHADDKIKDKRFYAGLNTQLYLYMNAFARDGIKPAGAYYYALDDKFVKPDEKRVSMYGRTLGDDDVVRATDRNFFVNGGSEIINGRIKNLKSGSTLDGAFADEGSMTAYMRYAEILAEKATDYVLDGVIVPSPFADECKYCEYGSACGFDEGFTGRTRNVSDTVKSADIVSAVAEETSKGGEDENGR